MDRATEYGEPITYDAGDRMEANGITPLEAGRKLIAVGLSRLRAAIDDNARTRRGTELAELNARRGSRDRVETRCSLMPYKSNQYKNFIRSARWQRLTGIPPQVSPVMRTMPSQGQSDPSH